MEAIIQKWGNSKAIRIPKHVLTAVGLKENDKVEIMVGDNEFTVKKRSGHISLEERLERFYGKPIEEIEEIESVEFDWGSPMGEEIW